MLRWSSYSVRPGRLFWMEVDCLEGFTPENVHNVLKTLLRNCGWVSVNREARIPYGTTQCLKKIDAACGPVVSDDEMAPVSFDQLSVLTKISRVHVVHFGSQPRMFIATNSKYLLEGNSSRGCFLFGPGRFIAHSRQSPAVVQTLFTYVASLAHVS